MKCDALLVDTISRSDTYPYVDIREDDVTMGHEATVSKVSEDQLFYLMSRGLSEDEAMAMVVRGFVEPIAKELPMEYALELNRLIEAADGRRGRIGDESHRSGGGSALAALNKGEQFTSFDVDAFEVPAAATNSGGSPRCARLRGCTTARPRGPAPPPSR